MYEPLYTTCTVATMAPYLTGYKMVTTEVVFASEWRYVCYPGCSPQNWSCMDTYFCFRSRNSWEDKARYVHTMYMCTPTMHSPTFQVVSLHTIIHEHLSDQRSLIRGDAMCRLWLYVYMYKFYWSSTYSSICVCSHAHFKLTCKCTIRPDPKESVGFRCLQEPTVDTCM